MRARRKILAVAMFAAAAGLFAVGVWPAKGLAGRNRLGQPPPPPPPPRPQVSPPPPSRPPRDSAEETADAAKARLLEDAESAGGAWHGEKAFSNSLFNCSPTVCAAVTRTTVMSECCKHTRQSSSSKIWPLIITGTPRSGTVFTHHVLRGLGVRVGHDWQSPGKDGMLSWIHFFNSPTDRYFGPGRLKGGRFRALVHLVRDPLKSITSIGCTEKLDWGNYTEFVRTNIPFDRGRFPPDGRLGVAMQMWVEMHEAIDRTGAPLWRLEDLVPTRFNKTKQLFRWLGADAPKTFPNKSVIDLAFGVEVKPRREKQMKNARKHRSTITWADLFQIDAVLATRAWFLAKSYG